MKIRKKDDGTYDVEIGIFRLASFEDGVGNVTDKGQEFVTTEPNGNNMNGIITVDGDTAVVTFTESNCYTKKLPFRYNRVV